ncbi:MAG: AAA family ATPase [Verrucomicrobiales bacterium]|nr:AAA family ATPase [Verrucomicrobiales bacterium]MBR90743.1 AAA family ATPase [Verrucomicrobiales bacterium]|tara:strand:+ start:42251 stop:43306 length:1056 start_codon:yes stop_codon:yes gene_type:complete
MRKLYLPDGAEGGDAAQVSEEDVQAIQDLREQYQVMRDEMARVIIGQDEVIEKMLICILSRGHGLLMGVPGLAKTLMVNSLAKIMSLEFSRIQFTPDLMPSDITGTEILQDSETPGRRQFEFVKGPIFANIVLADEINRTPPKTQSALLEAMQEHRVTTGGVHRALPEPFFVLATQNPIEQEGTYPLPEAQQDRFMFLIEVDYPSEEEEKRIARETTVTATADLKKVVDGPTLMKYQDLVERVPVPDHVYDAAVALVRMTRPKYEGALDWVQKWVTWGSGPRAVQYLVKGAKARAVLHGSYLTRMEDIEAVAQPVLTHRILTNFQAQAEGVDSKFVIDKLVEAQREVAAGG